MKLALIVATDQQGLIGRDNALPWRLSADLRYFKEITMGKPIVMGRKTHQSIGRVLPGRENIIISRDPDFTAQGCVVLNSLEQVWHHCRQAEQVMIMGGASLYEQSLDLVDMIYHTEVQAKLEGDTWFPEWDKSQWVEVSRKKFNADIDNDYPYSFIVYRRQS